MEKEEPLQPYELNLFRRRDFIFKGLLSIPFLGLAGHLWNLQIAQGKYYRNLSLGNRIRLHSIPAPRGLIYDRNTLVFAKNIPSYDLTLTPEDCPDIPGTLQYIAHALKISHTTLQKRVKDNRNRAKFRPIVLAKNLSWEKMLLINAFQEDFPGVSIDFSTLRFYPLQSSAAHAIGYTGVINNEQLRKVSQSRLRSSQTYGQKGLESRFNDYLIGEDGGEQVEVDSVGRNLRVLNSVAPKPGYNLRLHLDQQLQMEIEQIFGEQKGALVIMNPHNGQVNSLISKPEFDLNLFSAGLKQDTWNALRRNPDNVLNNRAIQGRYSPGSTFKLLLAVALLEEGIVDAQTRIECKGHIRHGARTYHCWKRSGHGALNLQEAIENSCNVFFYRAGLELGVDRIEKYAQLFEFDKPTSVDLNNELTGVLPGRRWKKQRFNSSWYPGETLNFSIGQGYTTVTPIRLAVFVSSLINGGKIVTPRIVHRLDDPSGATGGLELAPSPARRISGIGAATLDLIQQGMRDVVQGAHGSSRSVNTEVISLAGKTGTTQVISNKTRQKLLAQNATLDPKYYHHAWFCGYAPAHKPKVAVATFLENGQSGKNAAQLSRDALLSYHRLIEPIDYTV